MRRWIYNKITWFYDLAVWPRPIETFLLWLRYEVFYCEDDWR